MTDKQKSVRAKFWVTRMDHRNTPNPDDVCVNIEMEAVYNNGDPGNASWSKDTPSGKLEMTVTNQSAVDRFELGKAYYLEFTPAD